MSADQKWVAAIVFAAIVGPTVIILADIPGRLDRRLSRYIARMVDNALADIDWEPETDAAIDEAIALTVPLYGSEAACKIAAIIAHNEAARFDADAVDWTQPARWVQ